MSKTVKLRIYKNLGSDEFKDETINGVNAILLAGGLKTVFLNKESVDLVIYADYEDVSFCVTEVSVILKVNKKFQGVT